MPQSTVTFRIPKEEKDLVSEYAKAHNTSLTELYRDALMEKIENELDLQTLRSAIEASTKDADDQGVSVAEMEKMINGL